MTNPDKLKLIKQFIETASESLQQAQQLLSELTGIKESQEDFSKVARAVGKVEVSDKEKIIEGIFDGQNMVGPDGKQYSIPANYASKSKLVEGDILKLTIMPDGSFIYKQIGPIERKRVVGKLIKDEITNEYRVIAENKTYKVLLASVTYFKGEVGDEVVILIPKNKESTWAAVENIIKQSAFLKTEAKKEKEAKKEEIEEID